MGTMWASCTHVNIAVMPDDEIEALKAAVGARTDMALAEMLGVGRSAVSKWKERGTLPEKYRLLIPEKSDREIRDALIVALRFQFFGEPERGRWLLAASSILPPSLFGYLEGETDFARGKRIERATLRAMSLALHVSKKHLGKGQLDNDNDCQLLISTLKGNYAAEIGKIVSAFSSKDYGR